MVAINQSMVSVRWVLGAVAAILTVLLLWRGPLAVARYAEPSSIGAGGGGGGNINHVVLIRFKHHTTPMTLSRATSDLLELQATCLHPLSGKPYIKSVRGGKDHSPEGLQKGITHAFVFEFQSEEDRNYYVEEDPAHAEVRQRLREITDRIIVVDFTPNKFI